MAEPSESGGLLPGEGLSLSQSLPARLDIDAESVRNGLAQLAMTIIMLVHELLERQAIRRMDAGNLSDEEIERLGLTLMRQAEEIERMCQVFGLDKKDLNIDLGPLGRLL
jgi:hypothetical protein